MKLNRNVKKRISPHRKPSNLGFILLMLLPAVVITVVMIYYPIAKGVVMAFQNYNIYNLTNIKFVGIENFVKLFKPGPFNSFYGTLLNTVIWVFGSLVPQLLFGFFISMLLRRPFFGRGIYQGIISFPWAVSAFIIGIMWRWMYNGSSGVINDLFIKFGIISAPVGWIAEKTTALWSVIVANVWYGIPFFIIMITAALQSVPKELYEAAEVDGANAFRKFWVITFQHIKPVLVLTTLLRAIWIFNGPETIFSMTNGGPAGSTQIMTSYMYSLITGLDYGLASAVGLICTFILVVYTLFYLKVSRINSVD